MAHHEQKTINREQVVSYLNRSFSRAVTDAFEVLGNKATREKTKGGVVTTTALYDFQVDFSYLVDNIQRSPAYIVPKFISSANELIARIRELSNANTAA